MYTYFICANTVKDATTLTNLTFALDGGQVGTFVHVPKATTDFEYNVLGYAGTNLSKGQHQLIIQTTGDASDSLILFDYLVYSCVLFTVSCHTLSLTSSTWQNGSGYFKYFLEIGNIDYEDSHVSNFFSKYNADWSTVRDRWLEEDGSDRWCSCRCRGRSSDSSIGFPVLAEEKRGRWDSLR